MGKMTRLQKKVGIALLVLCVLTPIGIFLPMFFDAGDAWGEWSAETLRDLIGYVPAGLGQYAEIWQAPIPDYSLDAENPSVAYQSGYYIVSGILGATLTYVMMLVISKLLLRNAS